ncbi:MAG: NfeD family protein [Pseudomonadota bacterium]
MPFNLVLFAFLQGISPWWWIALGLALGVLEVSTGTTFLLGPAIAALAVGGLLFFEPDLAGTVQITVFGIAVLVSAVIAWLVTRRMKQRGDKTGLNRRGEALAGRLVEVREPFRAGIGTVSVDGVVWRARLAEADGADASTGIEPSPGTRLRIAAIDGATLLVEPAAPRSE